MLPIFGKRLKGLPAEMKNLLFWLLVYTLIMAMSQIFLKLGAVQMGSLKIKEFRDVLIIAFEILTNPFVILSVTLMVSLFFLWMFILSWFKLGLVFPMTALTYVFVALMSYFFLGEALSPINYFGIILIASGIFFLLYR